MLMDASPLKHLVVSENVVSVLVNPGFNATYVTFLKDLIGGTAREQYS
ncbi:MAG: hypothetical protein RXN82_03210 [Caldivirga sp.]